MYNAVHVPRCQEKPDGVVDPMLRRWPWVQNLIKLN